MPELPEVETVVRDLRPLLVGRRIASVRRASKVELRTPWLAEWGAKVKGRRVEEATRRGKWIVLRLDGGAYLVVHLGMTGQFTVVPASVDVQEHTHFVFPLEGGESELRFRDVRRFGRLTWLKDAAALDAHFIEAGLGPEPFGLDAALWKQGLENTTRSIKAVLLDQTVVAGVGNIYADEALFRAKIHPSRRADSLSAGEATRLRKAIEEVLTKAIASGGSTIRDYVGGSGLMGGFQAEFQAYGRSGEPCRRCKTALESVRLAGRTSHFCPKCQPAEAG
jgi:formamidopyrimidine-DNA glycosylase